MSIRRLLKGENFAPLSLQVITEAYELAIAELQMSDPILMDRLAKLTLKVAAREKELDAQRLRDAVSSAWRNAE